MCYTHITNAYLQRSNIVRKDNGTTAVRLTKTITISKLTLKFCNLNSYETIIKY